MDELPPSVGLLVMPWNHLVLEVATEMDDRGTSPGSEAPHRGPVKHMSTVLECQSDGAGPTTVPFWALDA